MIRVYALALLIAGCGHGTIQRAYVSPPSSAPRFVAPPLSESASHWVVTPAGSRFEIRADGPLGAEQTLRFRRFRAKVALDGDATFEAVIDVDSLEGPFADLVKTRLLEAPRFPEARFDGVLRRSPGTDACTIDGVVTLHGITKALHFDATVHEEPDTLRFDAIFEIARSDFDVSFHDARDSFLPDVVRVVLDVRARREKVSAEPIP